MEKAMQTEEEALAIRAVGGDEQALVDLLQVIGPAVRGRLAGRIPRHLQAVLSEDDVMQQTYVDAFLGIGQFGPRGEGSFLAWLTTLADRNLTDAVRMLEAAKRGGDRRRIQMDEERSVAALYELLGGTQTTPSGQAARREAQTVLRQAIGRLPELYQQVVRLYDLEGRPVAEVSNAMKRSQGAVFMLRARAHERLREIMGTASDYLSQRA